MIMISLRTLVNTTLFWIFVLFSFWAYTKRIDMTPAKKLIYAIGWSELGNLTITTQETLSLDGQSLLLQKLETMEKMIQATNMSCALVQMNTQVPSSFSGNNNQVISSLKRVVQVPVFSTVRNAQIDAKDQFSAASLVKVNRDTALSAKDIPELFGLLVGLSLYNDEQQQGLINVFEGSQLSLEKYSIEGSVLTLTIRGYKDLSTSHQQLVRAIMTEFFIQFSPIFSVTIL